MFKRGASDGGGVSGGAVALRKWSLDEENGLVGEGFDTGMHSSP